MTLTLPAQVLKFVLNADDGMFVVMFGCFTCACLYHVFCRLRFVVRLRPLKLSSVQRSSMHV